MTMRGKGPKTKPFQLYENEYLVICPYNMSHQVTNFRMMTHLPKCRNTYAESLKKRGETVPMSVCKYNWAHRVPAPEIHYHENSCNERRNFVPYMLEYAYENDNSKISETEKKYESYLTKGASNSVNTLKQEMTAAEKANPSIVKPSTASSTSSGTSQEKVIQKHDKRCETKVQRNQIELQKNDQCNESSSEDDADWGHSPSSMVQF